MTSPLGGRDSVEAALPDWRDEVCSAMDFWIAAEGGGNRAERLTCIGRARPASERGWYSVDLRGSTVNTDQIESFRLSGEDGPNSGPSYPVLEAVQVGPVTRVRVAEFVKLADPHLWQNKQPATHLLVKLRDGIAGLADARLANDLVAGRLSPGPGGARPVAGFTSSQQEAYESCLADGIRLVWGPPGTGKTRVLSEAITALLATDSRVLLVSATNIAVDNALLGVARSRCHRPGELLRVGTPHHPDVLAHPDICLPNLVRKQLAEVEQQRQDVENRLLRIREADDELARLEEVIAGFDAREYGRAVQLMAAEAAIPGLAEAAAQTEETARGHGRDAARLWDQVTAAEGRVQQLAAARSAFAEIDKIQQELADVIAAADDLSAQALTARHAADQINGELNRQADGTVLARMRRRGQVKRLADELGNTQQRAADLERRAHEAGELVGRRRLTAETHVRRLSATAMCGRADIDAADAALAAAKRSHTEAEMIARQAEDDLTKTREALLAAEAQPKPTRAQRALAEDAERRQLPAAAKQVAALRSAAAAARPERAQLETEYAKVHDRFDRLRKDAEGEIIRGAKVVATTLARLRTSQALMDGPYDVVLIDEVGAANMPEVLLAVSRAKRTAVLLGDFLQLGAVMNQAVEHAERADVERWLRRNVFEHCGINTAHDAQRHPGCTTLDVQYRFGPVIMRLANAIAYDGALKAGPNVRSRPEDDPEIVLIDVDGLGDLAIVRPTGRRSGWWPAGALLSRSLADYHLARGERTGIVTPYRHQVEATLEALRDQEASATAVTEVGTTHRFQGREFPIVVFDVVEDQHSKRWMAHASLRGSKWERDGTRLFTVAATRAQTRLYLICSRTQVSNAPDGSPLSYVAKLLRTGQARAVPATRLITPSSAAGLEPQALGPFSSELAEVLAEHVRVADIHDERSFYEVFSEYLSAARRSIWIWAPWTTHRVKSLLPVLTDVAGKGVQVALFVRDPGDTLQGKPQHQLYLSDLRAVLSTVVEINMMHQKIVVIDEQTVLLGSLNTLSQNWTREVMIVLRGANFARKLLEHEHAAEFARPPTCGACKGTRIDLRRTRSGDWYWRCYEPTCPARSPSGRKAWTQPAITDAKSWKASAPPTSLRRRRFGTAGDGIGDG